MSKATRFDDEPADDTGTDRAYPRFVEHVALTIGPGWILVVAAVALAVWFALLR